MKRSVSIVSAALVLLVLGIAFLPSKPTRTMVPCTFAPPFQHLSMNPVVIQLEVYPDGRVTWNGSTVDRQTLASYFTDAAQFDPRPAMFVTPHDWQMPYATVGPVLRLMREKKVYWSWLNTPRGGQGPVYLRAAVQCDTKAPDKPEPATTDDIEIMLDGRLLWNGRFVSREELARLLDRDARTTPQPLIQILIDPQTPVGKVSDVMLDVQFSGIERMRFQAD